MRTIFGASYADQVGSNPSLSKPNSSNQDQRDIQSRLRFIGREIEEMLRERRISIHTLTLLSGVGYLKLAGLIAGTIDASKLSLSDFEKVVSGMHHMQPVHSVLALQMWTYLTQGISLKLAEIN